MKTEDNNANDKSNENNNRKIPSLTPRRNVEKIIVITVLCFVSVLFVSETIYTSMNSGDVRGVNTGKNTYVASKPPMGAGIGSGAAKSEKGNQKSQETAKTNTAQQSQPAKTVESKAVKKETSPKKAVKSEEKQVAAIPDEKKNVMKEDEKKATVQEEKMNAFINQTSSPSYKVGDKHDGGIVYAVKEDGSAYAFKVLNNYSGKNYSGAKQLCETGAWHMVSESEIHKIAARFPKQIGINTWLTGGAVYDPNRKEVKRNIPEHNVLLVVAIKEITN